MRLWTNFCFFVCLLAFAMVTEYLGGISGENALSGTQQRGPNLLAFDGVWRSRGYGWILSISGRKVKLYHIAQSTCVKQRKQDLLVPGDVYPRLVVGSNGDVMRFSIDDPAYLYTFDRLARLPKRCSSPTRSDPISVFNSVVDYFDVHYPFFERRKVRWAQHVAKYRRLIHRGMSDKQLYKVLKKLLAHTGDGHVVLEAKVNGKKREFSSPNVIAPSDSNDFDPGRLLPAFVRGLFGGGTGYWKSGVGESLCVRGLQTRAKGKIASCLIEGNVGYLNIKSMEGIKRKKLKKAMEAAMAAFEGARAVIVDVSSNEGGYDTVSRKIAGYFAAKRTLAYYKHAGDDRTAQPQAHFVEPARVFLDPDIPVYLFTGGDTSSAAEVFSVSMRALPNVLHVGGRTGGIFSDPLWKSLPNGWMLGLSNEIYLDSDHNGWEGIGIKPQVDVRVVKGKRISAGDVASARSVIKFIRSFEGAPQTLP